MTQQNVNVSAATVEFSVAMPAYNEEEALPGVMEEAIAALSAADYSYEIVVADDGSRDRTPAILKEWQERFPDKIRIVSHPQNRGIAATVETLLRTARGNYIFLNGSDGQWKTAEGLRLMAARTRYDIIVGVRRCKYYNLWRAFVSSAYNALCFLLFGVRTYDAGSSKVIKREILDIPLTSKGVFREAERMIRAQRRGYRIGAVEVEFLPRRSGNASGARLDLVVQAIVDLLRSWWRIVICRES